MGRDNIATAKVTKGQVQGVAAGVTTGFAQGEVPIPGQTVCGCNLYTFAQITVSIIESFGQLREAMTIP